jgi:hypothetical protein
MKQNQSPQWTATEAQPDNKPMAIKYMGMPEENNAQL